jgi:hypothetical protein
MCFVFCPIIPEPKGHGEHGEPQRAQRELFKISLCPPWSVMFVVTFFGAYARGKRGPFYS